MVTLARPVPVASQEAPAAPLKAVSANLNFYYGSFHALKNISMPLHEKRVTALIGPSGCGKSTFLRCLNRMNDTIEAARVTLTSRRASARRSNSERAAARCTSSSGRRRHASRPGRTTAPAA